MKPRPPRLGLGTHGDKRRAYSTRRRNYARNFSEACQSQLEWRWAAKHYHSEELRLRGELEQRSELQSRHLTIKDTLIALLERTCDAQADTIKSQEKSITILRALADTYRTGKAD
jgi:hypothetical protein